MDRNDAKRIYDSGVWRGWDDKTKFLFQIQVDRLCMDFGEFHKATEKVLGRPVWTHEFAHPEALLNEYLGDVPKPTLREIFSNIPKEKSIFVILSETQEKYEK